MYIIKNAFRCINRAKGRNFLIGLIVVLLSVSSCLGLSIRQANRTLKKQYADDMEITASLNSTSRNNEITLDTLTELSGNESVKSFYMTASLYFSAGDNIEPIDVAGSFKQNKDFKNEYGDIKNGESKTETVEGTSTSSSASSSLVLLAKEESIPVENGEQAENPDSTDSNTDENPETTPEENSNQQPEQKVEGEEKPGEKGEAKPDLKQNDKDNQNSGNSSSDKTRSIPTMPNAPGGSGSGSFNPSDMPGGDTFITNKFFFNMASMNDFTVVGCDNIKALPSYVASLDSLDMESADGKCVISKNLADENGLKVGDTFTLKNPENDEESYTFTVAGIGDSSESTETEDTSSNAGFTDNTIYVNYAFVKKIVKESSALNGDTKQENNEEKYVALSPTYSGTFTFANLSDYNNFSSSVSDKYKVVSEDVSNYEQSISQLETLGKYATYFLVVIFIIGAFVLVIINLFSIRNRKYEIGVLTAIGMKKYKVALQFVTELFVVTFAALIIGSSIGAVTSVPVTNKLLTTINTSQSETQSESSSDKMTPPDFNGGGSSDSSRPKMPFGGGFSGFKNNAKNYIASVNSATNLTVILEMILVGIILTLISSLAAMLFVMRYEPLKILNNRD